ncbi:hypothetical protein MVEN_00511500 [Mycena venus]|uniref:Asparaginase n=1 Tax=Mycena venus TaxID=2733690 RepID=A0A8H6YIC5_9AGAR|nr:hypothetical protein MVEN_00511500 [Mycena venus]
MIATRLSSTATVKKFVPLRMAPKTYVVVHGGAGTHSRNSEAEVKKALRLACTQALVSPAAGNSDSGSNLAMDLVEQAIASLEDSPLLNAGCGSNLTLAGTVECDAAIMDGNSADFGSVGAVSGIKNPIHLARLILEHARVPDSLGRIPPLTLVSSGAVEFAQFRNATDLLVPPESLVTPRASKTWEIWKARLEGTSSSPPTPGSFPAVEDEDENGDGNDMEMQDLHALQDTVGAVALSITSNSNSGSNCSIASGVSSGGILLKHPGRVGEAAVFGAGCWAQTPTSVEEHGSKRNHPRLGMACSEQANTSSARISRARSLMRLTTPILPLSFPWPRAPTRGEDGDMVEDENEDVDVHAILQRVLAEEFWIPNRSPSNPDPSAGVVLLTTEEDGEGEMTARLWCAFTTPSMAIAYASPGNPLGKALILRRPKSVESRPNDQPRIFVTGIAL